MRYFDIGGWHLQYHESDKTRIGWEFVKRLNKFSSDNKGYSEICIKNSKGKSSVSEMIAFDASPVYEKKNGVFTHNIYRNKSSDLLMVIWIKPRSVFLGVVMEYQGRGVILSAPSGTGKTTHANIWCNLGLSTIINGDRALCRCIDGTWTAFGMPWCGSSGICENRPVPIHAIVVLEQHGENLVKRLGPLEALTRLLLNTFAPAWEPALYIKMLDRLDEIIPAVPIFLLQCRPDTEAAFVLKSALDSL